MLKCWYTNSRSILNRHKRDELELVILEDKLDIIGITESWLHDGIRDEEVSIKGYSMFRKDRNLTGKERGGGLLLFVKDEITAVENMDLGGKSGDSIWVRLSGTAGDDVLLGLCYRRPMSTKEEDEGMLQKIELASRSRAIIMGDFNYPDIDWEILQTTGNGRNFLNGINDAFLTQHVREATRGNNVLDLVLSTEPELVEDLKVTSPLANSDHNVITWNAVLETKAASTLQKLFNYHKGDYDKINKVLDGTDWDTMIGGDIDMDEIWTKFVNVMMECRDKYVPVKVGGGGKKSGLVK